MYPASTGFANAVLLTEKLSIFVAVCVTDKGAPGRQMFKFFDIDCERKAKWHAA